MKSIFLVLMLAMVFVGEVFAQSPVTNMRVQRIDTVIVVFYDLAATANVEAYASLDNGASFIGPLRFVTGAVGNNVLPGKDKILVWDIGNEVDEIGSSNVQFRLVTGAEQTSSVLAEGNLIARGWKVYQYDLKLLNDLLLVGNKAFQFREPLNDSEVRRIMANSNALLGYDKGVKRNRNGNIMLIAGGGLAVVGGALMMTKPFEKRHEFTIYGGGYQYVRFGQLLWNEKVFYIPYSNDRPYDFYFYDDGHISLEVGFCVAAVGVAVMGTGAILKFMGKRLIHRSVDVYNNSGRPLSRLEYDFNLTGNSVHLAIRF